MRLKNKNYRIYHPIGYEPNDMLKILIQKKALRLGYSFADSNPWSVRHDRGKLMIFTYMGIVLEFDENDVRSLSDYYNVEAAGLTAYKFLKIKETKSWLRRLIDWIKA